MSDCYAEAGDTNTKSNKNNTVYSQWSICLLNNPLGPLDWSKNNIPQM